MTNEPLSICNTDVIQLFGNSDHSQVIFSLFSDNNDCANDLKVTRYDWANADYDGMSDYVAGIDWLLILTTELTSESLWAAFAKIMHSAIDMFVPAKHVSENSGVQSHH